MSELINGYAKTIENGLSAVRELGMDFSLGIGRPVRQIFNLYNELCQADAIVIGAGAGLSTSAGLTYVGSRFSHYFTDFAREYAVHDMNAGGFRPFPDKETYWAWWSRQIYCNRYVDPPKPVYNQLLELINGKNYFVITTNTDHQFQRAGFDKDRLFYTQGDYGLFQGKEPQEAVTYDNEETILAMMEAQGFVRNDKGEFIMPEDKSVSMRIPTELIPTTPGDDGEVIPSLRVYDNFVEDDGWKHAADAYWRFLEDNDGKRVLFWEIGVGDSVPDVIKYPFWQMTRDNPNAYYCCVNRDQAFCPKQLEERSACIIGDAGELIGRLLTF